VTTAIDIPKQFRRHAVRGLTREPKVIWTRNRKIAQQIEKMDEQVGGRPQVWKYVARRCPHCRRWWIGSAARFQHEFESLAWVSGKTVPPCNLTCNNARVMGELFSKAGLLVLTPIAPTFGLPGRSLNGRWLSQLRPFCEAGKFGVATDQNSG